MSSTDPRPIVSLFPGKLGMTPSRTVWMLLVVSAVALWPALSGLGRIWHTMFDYQHGPLIAAVTIFWLARSGARIDAAGVRPMRMALLLLAASILAWMVAYRANSELMQQLLLPIIPVLAVVAALGLQAGRSVAGPLAFLYFAIPVWELLLPLLQALTTAAAETVLGWMNVPATVEGHHVTIPSGQFSIIEGCSGKRYLIIALAFACIAGVLQKLRTRAMLGLFASATALALVVNWIRVVIVIYAGHVTEMQHYLVATEHKSLGYFIFVPLLLAIAGVARRLGRTGNRSERIQRTSLSSETSGRPEWQRALVLSCIPLLIWTIEPMAAGRAVSLGRLPVMTGAWQGPLPPDYAWQPHFVGPVEEVRAAYAINGSTVEVYLNVYALQSPGRELVSFGNSVAPANRWTLIRRLPHSSGGPVMSIVANSTGERWVVAHIFAVGGLLTSASSVAQLYHGLHAVLRPVPAGVVAMAAACGGDCNSAAQRVESFWRDHGENLAALVPVRL